jgi:hypothetical protein
LVDPACPAHGSSVHSALIGVAACILFAVAGGGFVRLAKIDSTLGTIIIASLLLRFLARRAAAAQLRRTPLMFEDEFPMNRSGCSCNRPAGTKADRHTSEAARICRLRTCLQ